MMLKRGIRGMLPDFRKGQGKQAFQRIKCYDGIPEEFKNKKVLVVGDIMLAREVGHQIEKNRLHR